MSYTLFIGDRPYSSWSMRGWLLLEAFGIEFTTKLVPMYSEAFTQMQADHHPARTVPSLRVDEDGETAMVWESLAIAETLAERHPNAGLWPEGMAARAASRALSGEMHAGFHALRDRPSMNLRRRYEGFEPTEAEATDAARVQELWAWALDKFGGPYLGGAEFTAVDAMYAPVATRFVTYAFPMDAPASAYVKAVYANKAFRRWHAMADAAPRVLDRYDLDLPSGGNTGAPRVTPLPAAIYDGAVADAINELCPYSGAPVEEDCLATIDGKIVGFCNTFCRDKSIADATAWPQLMALL